MNSRFDVDMEKIEDTIFSIANNPQYGWFLLIGPNRVTDIYKTREEALKVIDVIPPATWDIIFKMVCIASEAAYKVDRNEEGEVEE